MLSTIAQYYVVPYSWIGTDDHAISGAIIARAATASDAVELVAQQVRDCEAPEWGYAANVGCRPEHAGDNYYYVCVPCDCGDEDCESAEHEQGTVAVSVHGRLTVSCESLEEARGVALTFGAARHVSVVGTEEEGEL